MPNPDIQATIDRVTACGPIRAWSVIVTVLGDLCRTREDRISAQVMAALIGPLGISAQSARVAIHRLRRDGWVETDRAGRTSLYRLSALGWDRTEAVRPRIYARARPRAAAMLVTGPPDMAQADLARRLGPDAVLLAPRTALVPPDRPVDASTLAVPLAASAVPAWVDTLLVEPVVCAGYEALAAAAGDAEPVAGSGNPLQSTTLRLAILHHWRRLCLRHSPLADGLMPSGWPGDRARGAVAAALDLFPRHDLATLSEAARAAGPADGRIPRRETGAVPEAGLPD